MGVNRDELVEEWLREERQPFSGWDFSYLDGRIKAEREPWSYLERAAELMRCSSSVIDLDTGGGEKLLSLRDHWPARVVATEDYAPNFGLATERLSPLGVEVVKVAVTDTTRCHSLTASSISYSTGTRISIPARWRVCYPGWYVPHTAGAWHVAVGPAGGLRRES